MSDNTTHTCAHEHHGHQHEPQPAPQQVSQQAHACCHQDKSAAHTHSHSSTDQTHACHDHDKHGGKHEGGKHGHAVNREPGTKPWMCPMCAGVESDRPGTCPKCGMALEKSLDADVEQAAEWTCPMHPEVVSDKPGTCPKCGMALEPKMPTVAAAEENPELADFRRRFGERCH